MIDIVKFVALQFRLLALACLVLSANSYAAMTINFYESGGNVIVDASGSLKIPFVGTSLYSAASSITPTTPSNITFAGSTYLNSSGAGACTRQGGTNIVYGTSTIQATAVSETVNFPFLINLANSPAIRFDSTKAAGTIVSGISNSATYAGTFSSLGITPGMSITCTYGGGTYDETIYVTTGWTIPVASAVSKSVAFNSSQNIVALNSTGPPTSVAVSTQATRGTAVASGTTITYTPNPNTSGVDTFQYTATNYLGTSSPATVTVTVLGAGALTATQAIASKKIGNGVAATPFTPVTASGGTAPFGYTISPALPAGLSISSSTGEITGTPSGTLSATTYTVTVTDAVSASASKTFSLTIDAAPTATQAVATKVLTRNVAATSFTPVTGSGGTGDRKSVV